MATSTEGIIISDVRLTKPAPPWKCNPKVQIVIRYGSQARKSKKIAFKKSDPCIIWDESFFLVGELTDDTRITLTIVRVYPFIIRNTAIDSCEHRVIDLLKMQNSSGSCELDVVGKCQLTFKIEKSPDVVASPVQQVIAASEILRKTGVLSEVSNSITSAVQVYNDNEETWSSFLDKFQVFMGAMDEISEISPYVKVAWSVLSFIPKTIIAKKNRDDKIKQLCDKLEDVYNYITDAKRLPELTKTQSKTLSMVVRQTTECAYFIRAYCTEDTVQNTLKGIMGSMDRKIQDFNDTFDRLMGTMRSSVNLETSIVTLRVKEDVDEIINLNLLKEMRYDGSSPQSGKRCSPGTRKMLIEDILKRINDDASPQILVLSGQAGVGKSTMAHTIAGMFKEQNRLGSMFCFDRSTSNKRNCLFSTISRDLADGDASWRKKLVEIIKLDTAVRGTGDLKTQFDQFIIKPSENTVTIGPVIIVVDALDESGSRDERKEILEILLGRWSELPKNYRLIVTTRPEQDIEAQLACQKLGCKRMEDVNAEETRRDIEVYVSKRLGSISSTLDNIDENWRSILAKHAQGLFQWAETACRFIDPTVIDQELVREKWKTCVSNSSSPLYELYRQIILSQPESRHPSFKERFKTVVGAIITAQEPLSIHALQNIFGDIKNIKSTLAPFGSLFSGVHDSSTLVQPLHTSLFDFFTTKKIFGKDEQDGEKINEYYIDTSDQSQMTFGCLKVMNRMLCFNICHLETSHLCNEDVPNLELRVKEAIPLHLSYSCRFWGFHLQSSPVTGELIHAVRTLMDDKLLYYFEALSLLKSSWSEVHGWLHNRNKAGDEQGCATMQAIVNWCKDADTGLAEDAMDVWEFALDFGAMMSASTPHIYLSALPFTPRSSFVSRRYLKRFPGLFTFDVGQPVGSSRRIGFMRRREDRGLAFSLEAKRIARKFALSPKAEYMASVENYNLCVWNYVTGEEHCCAARLGGFYHRICDIVFSNDGELVYCCSDDGILIWNMGTKKLGIETYEEIVGAKCCHCAISSDGRFILLSTEDRSGSSDRSFRLTYLSYFLPLDGPLLLMDRRNRRVVKRFEKGYSYPAISPNGDWIAFYRDSENKLYIWNTGEQTQHVLPCIDLKGLQLTNNYIAFGNGENYATIEIWDLRKSTKVTEIQHGSRVVNFFLSPDDQYILSTSAGMYSIWSVSTGKLISRSYPDNRIGCLGFSHDSKSIVLKTYSPRSSSSVTIHVQPWDEFIEPNHPHGNEIESVYAIWQRGSYLILQYTTILDEYRLRISDTMTTIFETELQGYGPVDVCPDQENACVVYCSSRGLCFWNEKEGEIVVDGSAHSIIALVFLDNYLISGCKKTISVWNSRTRKLVRGPINLSYELESLLPVRGTRFAVTHGTNFIEEEVEVRECESGDRVGIMSMSTWPLLSRLKPVSANGKHIIYASDESVDIRNLAGRSVKSIRLSSISLYSVTSSRRSLNGKYIAWIDNDKIKLFDVDTETLVTGPSLARRATDVWLSDDSKRIIIMSKESGLKDILFLDVWDIQSQNMVTETIPCPFTSRRDERLEPLTLILSKKHLIVFNEKSGGCYVWDLDTYGTMSPLYKAPPLLAGSEIKGAPVSNKTEILDYALMAWEKASLPSFARRGYSEWIRGLQDELLFWVPERMKEQLWLPCMAYMSHRKVTKLNFTNFVHGTNWTECGPIDD